MQKRTIRSLTIMGFLTALMVGFQNFTSIPLEKMKLAKLQPDVLIAYAEDNDIRRLAPHRPENFDQKDQSKIASPETGSDLDSIGQDWVKRQGHLLTGGAEQKFLDDVNKKINRALKREEASEQTGESGASATATEPSQRAGERSYINPSVRFTALNRVELGFPNEAQVSCSVEGSNLRWDLSRPLSDRIDFNLRHETTGNANTVRLHYNW